MVVHFTIVIWKYCTVSRRTP